MNFTVTFYIMDAEGNNLEGANVNMNEIDVLTNVEGVAEFEEVSEGDYGYTVTMEGYNEASDALTVDDNYDVSINLEVASAE